VIMAGFVKVGVQVREDLPPDRLVSEELTELRRLLAARQALAEQVQVAEQRVQLLLLTARDSRRLQGEIRVDPESGAILATDVRHD